MSGDFFGRGIGYPFTSSTTGGVRESSGITKIEESIRIILGTEYGERVMRPKFGCNLKSLAFAPNNQATANLAKYYVEQGLKQWEPRITVSQVSVTNDWQAGALLVQIDYRVNAAPGIESLIYPFYLEKA